MLTGVGSVGKTRLPLRVVADVMDDYSDGSHVVASLQDPALVAQTVAGVLGIHEQPGFALQVIIPVALQPRQVLLVVDNCERLIESTARVVDTPELRVVDEQMRDVPAEGETIGEVVMRGYNLMKGHSHDEAAIVLAFRGGWFDSGDLQ